MLKRWQEFRALSPAQRRQLRDGMQRFKRLPAHQRQKLRNQFKGLSARERARALRRMQKRADVRRRQR